MYPVTSYMNVMIFEMESYKRIGHMSSKWHTIVCQHTDTAP